MAEKPADGTVPVIPASNTSISDAWKGEFVPIRVLDPNWKPSGTYGRLQTKMCYADGRELRAEELWKILSENQNLSPEQSLAIRKEISDIDKSMGLTGPSMSAGLNESEIAYLNEQSEKAEDLERWRTSPIFFVEPLLRKMGMTRDQAHAVSVQLEGGLKHRKRVQDLQEKIRYKAPFEKPPY